MPAYNVPIGRPPFEVIEHTADWSIRVWAENLPGLFACAAQGMAYLLAGNLAAVALTHTAQVSVEGYDAVDLLVAWLSELAYLTEQDGLVFTTIDALTVTPTGLTATVRGGRPPELLKHIKAVTYHDLTIRDTGDGLETTIVFDV